MVRRRDLLIGATAMLGTVGAGARPAAAAPVPAQRSAALALAASGFSLPGGLFCPVPYLSRAAWVPSPAG